MSVTFGNSVVTPVEVERLKDVYFMRVRGDHNSESFIFHYVNLSPATQSISLYYAVMPPDGILIIPSLYKTFVVPPGESIEDVRIAGVGYTLHFIVRSVTKPTAFEVESRVYIPPKA